MYRIVYTCRVLTPMSIKGATKEKVDTNIRAASIKGAMRFWWRALGSFPSEKIMREYEQNIFGGIGESALKSNFKLRGSF